MNFLRHIFIIVKAAVLCLVMGIGSVSGFTAAELKYETAYGNPLKGFVPFYSEEGAVDTAAHSMEFFYIPLSELISDSGEYTVREGLEPYLTRIASRSHQAIFRVYLDYPASALGEKAVPQYIWDMGVKKIPYTDFGGGISPDYTDDRLICELVKFTGVLGREYDGDPRIAYITAGLIGHWGEWHCFACPEAMPSDEQQRRIVNAFNESFSKTEILMRYPGTPGTENGKTGYHDDSFTFETLGGKKQSWFYYNRLKKAKQTGIWRTHPIGGEFRPEGQQDFLNGKPTEGYRDYDKCLKKTHCSWLMMNKAFADGLSETAVKNANAASAKLGYDFTVTKASVRKKAGKTVVYAAVKNVGVAPLYADAEIVFSSNGAEAKAGGEPLNTLMPGETFIYRAELEMQSGDNLTVRIESKDTPSPIRFSNANVNTDSSLTIGSMK